MVGTCALNDMNANMKLIGIFILIILLSIVVIYFMYCSRNKHSEILENFTSNEATLTYHNYGSEHTGPYTDYDKKTITGDVTLRDCQVYFVGEDQQGDCDEEYRANPNTTCKYVFKDDWKEIANIKVGEGEGNNYANKIYNQSYTYTENDIKNHHLTAQCVKKFESESDKRYIYRDNELIVYNHDGSSDGNTLELNYKTDESDESDEYVKGDFISMTFGNNGEPSDNYSNVIDSICSIQRNAPLGLGSNLKFYKFILNNSNEIKEIEMVMLDGEKKAFQTLDFNMRDFLNSDNLSINYSSIDNIFFLRKDSNIVEEQVDVYQFKYNYLCNNEDSGKILEYKKNKFTNNKNYISLKNSIQSLNVELKYDGDLVRVPNGFKKDFEELTTKSNIIIKIDQLKDTIKSNHNSFINSNIAMIESEIQNYETHRDSANSAKNSFGVDMSFQQIIASRFNKIKNNNPTTTESIQPFNFIKGINITFIDDDLPVDTGYKSISTFTHDGSTNNQKEYDINFPVITNCDILIVGGGGAGGGGDDCGGGGAGGLVLINNIMLNGNYKILVGRGGVGDTSEYNGTDNGRNTIFNVYGTDGVDSFKAVGGGGGGVGHNSSNSLRDGNDGGSGGGSSGEWGNASGGRSTQNNYMYNGTRRGYGNRGGNNTNSSYNKGSAGGGGAGFPGTNSNSTNKGVPGGDGLSIVNSINLKTHFNIKNTTIGHHIDGEVYFAGGGGGGNNNYVSRANNSGGKGGGGQGSTSGSGKSGSNGLINSGGGGGGGQYIGARGKGGNGGSGIVIIRENIFGGHCSDVNTCFTDSMKNEAHERASLLQHFINYDKNELKYGAISGYIFLEKNIAYSNINITLLQTQSIVQDLRTRIESVSGDYMLLDTVNNIGNDSFTPTTSGFYKIKTTFLSKNIDTKQISSSYKIICNLNGSYFNLKNYIYINQLWPDSWNTIGSSNESKINSLNENFRDIKYSNNTVDSVSALVNGYLNDNDMFNYKFWDSKIRDLESDKSKEYTIDNYPICNSSNAYNKSEYQNFTMICDELKKLYDFKTTFNNALSPNNLEALFSGKSFDNPEFVKAKIEATFEGIESITNYITYEKKSNKEDRTQKSEKDPYYNYFEDKTTERSIYILKK